MSNNNVSVSHKQKELRLPISRIKTIMKSSPDVENIGQDSLYLVTKATEFFIQHLAVKAYSDGGSGSVLNYKDIAEVVQTNETLTFLREIMPRKITYRQYKELVKKKEKTGPEAEDSDVEEEMQEEEEEEEEEEDDQEVEEIYESEEDTQR